MARLWCKASSRESHLEPDRMRSTMLPRMEAGLWRAGGCTDARTCDPRVGWWCTRIPKKREKETPGEARSEVAAAPQASALAMLSWKQHDAPGAESV